MPSCPQCQAELRSDDPAGLCPHCLIQGALGTCGVDDFGTEPVGAATTVAPDKDFGRYQVIHPLGEGGMGTVYLAEQLEPIRRRVALKVVKLGMDTAQVLGRFDNERQALAMMDHPNIAQIFDAGATTTGRPYFVMEYIDGAPITQYCDRERMTTRERLALFLAVCRAVQHAHQKGVIHRDLKPSNVLVMEHDGSPIPKVIDFGIATATDKWAVEKTLLTQFGQIVGTPEYASPEQADTITGDVDESSDVYSLGVLLYQLLIGAVPFDATTLRNAGLAETLRIIREEEAPSLSRKLTSMGAAPPRQRRPELDHDEGTGEGARAALHVGVGPRSRCPAAHGEPARAGLAARQAVPGPEVSPPAQAGRSRDSRRIRIPRVERNDGLVAFSSRFRHEIHTDRQGHDRPRAFRQQDRRPCIRRHTTPGTVGGTSTIAGPHLAFGHEGPTDARSHGTAQRGAADFGSGSADLRANCRCGCLGRLDRTCWKPVRIGLARKELQHRKHSG